MASNENNTGEARAGGRQGLGRTSGGMRGRAGGGRDMGSDARAEWGQWGERRLYRLHKSSR